MSHHSTNSSNYMDCVPVKISEKYKPPPKVTIPQAIVNRLNSDGYPEGVFDYDFTLEKNVICKIDEWKKVRQMEKEKRQERLRKNEIIRAREIEEKQKELLTAVSYPDAEDLSSGDESSLDNSQSSKEKISIDTKIESVNSNNQQQSQQFSPLQQQSFDTILKPTVVPDYFSSTSPPVFLEPQTCAIVNKPNGKINYSDFENDTSSPFDNIELKTINDLDVLAQVLNVTQIHSNKSSSDVNVCTNPIENDDRSQSEISNENVAKIDKNYYRNSTNCTPTRDTTSQWNQIDNRNNMNNIDHIVHHAAVNHHANLFQNTNNAFYPFDNSTQYQNYANMNGVGSIAVGQQRGNHADYYFDYNNLPSSNQNYLCRNYHMENNLSNLEISSYQDNQNYLNLHQKFLFQPPLAHHLENIDSDHILARNLDTINICSKEVHGNQGAKNKSKSVPDILQELNNEIRDSELRRSKNHSQILTEQRNDYDDLCKNEKINIKLPGTFMKLSPSSQCLVQNISSMGFPLERVSKIVEKLGNDDKKIVEHLIPLSELLDLGFDESKVSDALLQFDNNKEKALDFLIS